MPHGLPLEGIAPHLWSRVSRAPRRLLMLDYDGTLAPFTVVRDEARPLPRALDLLRRVATDADTALAIVSGRPVCELERLVGDLPALLVGEHGWERRLPDGSLARAPLPPGAEAGLDQAERLAGAAGWAGLLERKRAALVLHTRALPAAEAAAVEERCATDWARLIGVELRLDRIAGGVELRARGQDKGTVVRALGAEFRAGTLGVFVGDDRTDEDAFGAVRAWGFGVRVGSAERPSLALGRLPSPEAVPDFLEEWLSATGRTSRRRPG